MCRMFRFILVLGLVLSLGAAEVFAAEPLSVPSVDVDSLFKRVNAEKGKVVVLNVFASWCPPCRKEIPRLVNLRREFPEDKLAIIGLSVDGEPKALMNYISELRMNYPVLLAARYFTQDFSPTNAVTGERVEIAAVPMLLIFNKKGDLVQDHVGLMNEADLRAELNRILSE